MKQLSLIPILVCCFAATGVSQTPDWSTSIASIFYENCTVCHREGNIGPFPIVTYDDALTYGLSIQEQVNAKLMPPWPADPNYSHFAGEKVLSDYEIQAINDWVNGGMPSGNLDLAPAPPVFPEGTAIVNPDDTVLLPVFTLPLEGDVNWTFVNASGYDEEKYVNQIDFVPGNNKVVHHVIYYHDTSSLSYQKDLQYPGPGYATSFGNPSPYMETFSGWNPGRESIKLPPNMGFVIPKGADFVTAIHYAPGNLGEVDSSKIFLKFCTVPDVRPVFVDKLLYHNPPSLLNPPFLIPANTTATFYEASKVFQQEHSMLGLSPHSHLICQSWEVYMVDSSNDTTRLLYIPKWLFNWQMSYFFTKVIKIPVGAQMFATITEDNTVNNPNNPNNPPKDVESGESTFQEMATVRFWLMMYEPGDEDIILDSAYYTSSDQQFQPDALPLKVFPNPAGDKVLFTTFLPDREVSWTLTDPSGIIHMSHSGRQSYKGAYSEEIDLEGLSSGIYFLNVVSGTQSVSRSVVVSR